MKKVAFIAATIVLGLALTAAAQPGAGGSNCRHDGPGMACGKMAGGHGMMMRRGGGMGDGPGLDRLMALADKLELTDAQKTKLKQQRETFQLEQIDRRAAFQKAQLKLRGLMRDDASTAEISKAIDDVAVLRADMAKMRVRHHAEMKSVLTEKQQQTLKELRSERRMNFRGGMFDRNDDRDDMDEPDEPETPQPGTGH